MSANDRICARRVQVQLLCERTTEFYARRMQMLHFVQKEYKCHFFCEKTPKFFARKMQMLHFVQEEYECHILC